MRGKAGMLARRALPWDIATATFRQSKLFNFQITGFCISPSGTDLFVTKSLEIAQYALQTAWDITSASFVTSIGLSQFSSDPVPQAISFKPDGTQMYFVGSNKDSVRQHSLSTPWSLATATETDVFSVAVQEVVPTGLAFKTDGTRMYVVGAGNDAVREYSLATAWDVSTASYVRGKSVVAEETAASSVFFSPDGAAMYVSGTQGEDVNQYALATPWDVSTESYVKNFSLTSQTATPLEVFFRPDGLKMYVAGGAEERIFEYDIGYP